MGRVGYLVLVIAGAGLGLALLLALLTSSVTDARDLVDTVGWWGLAIFLAWPIFGIVATLHDHFRG